MKEITVYFGGKTAYCAVFGRGDTPLLLLPGLSDGLRTVKGAALPLALSCRALTKSHTVYALSRVNELSDGYAITDMARDAAGCMETLGADKFDLFGVSMGGMIAQHIAAGYPGRVRRTVLAVTSQTVGDVTRENVSRWIGFAESGRYRDIMVDTAEKTYTERYLKILRPAYPLLGLSGRKDMRRFIIQAKACLCHDASGDVGKIVCPTLVIGGGRDKTIGPGASEALASAIPGAKLYIYPDLGHGLFDEAKDFYRRAEEFFGK